MRLIVCFNHHQDISGLEQMVDGIDIMVQVSQLLICGILRAQMFILLIVLCRILQEEYGLEPEIMVCFI